MEFQYFFLLLAQERVQLEELEGLVLLVPQGELAVQAAQEGQEQQGEPEVLVELVELVAQEVNEYDRINSDV